MWLALVGFAGVAVASLAILWPRRWEFTVDPQSVIHTYIEADEPTSIDDLRRDLSLYMRASLAINEDGLQQLVALFQVATVLLVLEVALWTAAILLPG